MSRPADDELGGLAKLMREHTAATVSAETDRQGKLALARRLRQEAEVPRRSQARLYSLGAAVALAAGIAFAFVRFRPLAYEVRGARSEGPYISAPATAPVTVAFSDGSTIDAAPGARLRVDEPRVAGARVLMERGHANVHVQHRAGSAWNFVAGPFDVHVTGTRFDLGWDPSSESMELRLYEGSVEVRGPFVEAPVAVRAGQRLHADLPSRSMLVGDIGEELTGTAPPPQKAEPPSAPAPERAATATAPHVEAPASSNESAPARPQVAVSSEGWAALVARGQFETVVAKAGERGSHECEKSCSAADLRALADAARYTGRSSVAEGALKALRSRYGGTKDGRSAAFLLGRLDEARGAMSSAERWYDTYLEELPGGDLAAEALAGKMRAVLATSGRSAARPVAEKYLSLYPNGVHAGTARGIVAGTERP